MNVRVSRLVLSLLIAVLLFTGGVLMLQDDFIYFPEKLPQAAILADARQHGVVPWPSEEKFRGVMREPSGSVRGTVVLFHGNAGHAGQRDWYVGQLGALGLRVILAEYPGYGSRAGKLGETALVADAAETLSIVRRQFPGPLILAGESLGAGVAAAVAGSAGVDAMLLITPWDRLESVARHHYPWLPVGALLRDRYDSIESLSRYDGRIAVVIAEQDSIVPPELGRRLFESLPKPKRLWVVPAADHNDWMARVDAAWWQSIVSFLIDG